MNKGIIIYNTHEIVFWRGKIQKHSKRYTHASESSLKRIEHLQTHPNSRPSFIFLGKTVAASIYWPVGEQS